LGRRGAGVGDAEKRGDSGAGRKSVGGRGVAGDRRERTSYRSRVPSEVTHPLPSSVIAWCTRAAESD
jgi:hypothetical protein